MDVFVDFGYGLSGDNDRIRVIVYGPHTLNKTTLDKPGISKYFDDITVDQVRSEDEGWNKIQDKPSLWIR